MNRKAMAYGVVVACCAALAGGWFWLFSLTRGVADAHTAIVQEMVLQLKAADAQWNADLLKSQSELSGNYDSLVQPLERFGVIRTALMDVPGVRDNVAAMSAVESMRKAVDEKALLVDRFKSGHALLRNSLRYIPTAQQDMQIVFDGARKVDAPARQAQVAGSLGGGVGRLIGDLMRYNAAPDTDIASAISLRVMTMQEEAFTLPEQQRDYMLNLFSHAKTVLRERPRVMTTLDKVFRVPVAGEIDNVQASLLNQFKRGSNERTRYERWLQVYSVVAIMLAALAGAVGIKMGRGA